MGLRDDASAESGRLADRLRRDRLAREERERQDRLKTTFRQHERRIGDLLSRLEAGAEARGRIPFDVDLFSPEAR